MHAPHLFATLVAERDERQAAENFGETGRDGDARGVAFRGMPHGGAPRELAGHSLTSIRHQTRHFFVKVAEVAEKS